MGPLPLSRLRCRQTHLLAQAGELIDKLGSHLRFLLIGEERGVDGVEGDALYAVGVIAPVPGQHQELVRQRCTEEGWIVGVDGHQYSGIVERPERVVGEAGHDAGAKVAGWAELERNAVPGEAVDEPRIVYSAHAMPDPLHTEKIEESQMVAWPVVSPACATVWSPAARARAKSATNGAGG